MKRVSKTNPLEKCRDIDTFDFNPWKEKEMTKIGVNNDNEMNVKIMKKN